MQQSCTCGRTVGLFDLRKITRLRGRLARSRMSPETRTQLQAALGAPIGRSYLQPPDPYGAAERGAKAGEHSGSPNMLSKSAKARSPEIATYRAQAKSVLGDGQ